MTAKTNALENDLVAYLFNNTSPPWNGATQLFISLHTADPGEAGDQATSEATYTGYSRVAVARTTAGFTAPSTGQTGNAGVVTFGQCTAGAQTITHVGIGTASSGAGRLLYRGALATPRALAIGDTPSFAVGTLTVTED